MKAKEILIEVINDLIDKETANISNYQHVINPRNVVYKLFRSLVSIKIRDKIWKFYSLYKRSTTRNMFLRENFLLRHLLDFIKYIISKDPEIPLNFFPNKDHKKMVEFIRGIIIASFYENIDLNLYGKKILNEYLSGKDQFINSLRIKGNYWYMNGFKSKIFPDSMMLFYNKISFLRNKGQKIAFDLGAYIGDSAYTFLKLFNLEKVYAFEPDPDNMKILKENININNLTSKVIPIPMATGKQEGSMYLSKGGSASQLLKKIKITKVKVKVKVVPLDKFVIENKLDKVDLIKMDIEGAEFDTLKGAVKTLKKYRPDLIIAVYHKGEHFFEIPGWLKKIVPEYNLRFLEFNAASPIIERYIVASIRKI